MNVFKRGMIFVTFFGSCFAIALLLASLGTRQWVVARAKSSKNPDSDGRVQLGLFDGKKELNVAYGWRTDNFTGKCPRQVLGNIRNLKTLSVVFMERNVRVISVFSQNVDF